MTPTPTQEQLITIAGRLLDREQAHSIVHGNETREALDAARAEMNRAVRETPFRELAELIAASVSQKFTVPDDAHPLGTIVEAIGGTLFRVTHYGFDGEGSFGYFGFVRNGDMLFTYHHREMRAYTPSARSAE